MGYYAHTSVRILYAYLVKRASIMRHKKSIKFAYPYSEIS